MLYLVILFFFFQAEDGIRDLVRSRGLGDVYKRQEYGTELWIGDIKTTISKPDNCISIIELKKNIEEILSLIHI